MQSAWLRGWGEREGPDSAVPCGPQCGPRKTHSQEASLSRPRSPVGLADVDASDVIAIVALVVSAVSGVIAIVSLVLALRESDRRDEEIRLLRDESGRREEEVALLRQQVAAEQLACIRQQVAQIVVLPTVPTSGSAQGIEYSVTVTNEGEYLAKAILVELVDSNDMTVGAATAERGLWKASRYPSR